MSVDAMTTAKLLGVLVPLLVAFVTKKTASSSLKGVLNTVGSALVGSLVYLQAKNGGYDWTGFVNSSFDTLLPSVAAYYALWRPTGVIGHIAEATKGFGLGSADPVVDVAAEDPVIDPTPDVFIDRPIADTYAADVVDDPQPAGAVPKNIAEGVPDAAAQLKLEDPLP